MWSNDKTAKLHHMLGTDDDLFLQNTQNKVLLMKDNETYLVCTNIRETWQRTKTKV